MSEYTPAPHEARARFISGSIDLIRRRDNCTLAEAEETAIAEWERWVEWHNVRVRRGVVTEEPEWEYGEQSRLDPARVWIVDPESQSMIWVDIPESKKVRRRAAGPWVPVEQGDET